MKSIRIFNRRAGSLFAASALLLATVAPTFAFSSASAALLTGRSVQLSSSAANADNVSYKITFTATTAAASGVTVVDFCSNSPLINSTCTTPTGFDTESVSTPTPTTTVASSVGSSIRVTKAIVAGSNTFDIASIDNPTAKGSLYVRILTYTDSTAANGYTAANAVGTYLDEGSVALSIVDQIGVSAAVLETMTFCVSSTNTSQAANANCGGTLLAPNITLGVDTGGIKALQVGTVSTGTIYTQISTNANDGAIVRLKTDSPCGGLRRLSQSTCDIAPATTGSVVANDSKFGLKLGTSVATTSVSSASGTLAASGSYNASTYFLNHVDANTGVASTYGDPVFNTNNDPVNNMNMPIEFAATINNNTPAGQYNANLSMIASGTF